jgi:hypothetical protein
MVSEDYVRRDAILRVKICRRSSEVIRRLGKRRLEKKNPLHKGLVFAIIRQDPIIVWFLTHRRSVVRSALVTALIARAESPLRLGVRRFLCGLSCDELEFIASFLGACILESAGTNDRDRFAFGEFRRRQAVADREPEDRDLKTIILIEYLCRSGMQQSSMPVRSGARSG